MLGSRRLGNARFYHIDPPTNWKRSLNDDGRFRNCESSAPQGSSKTLRKRYLARYGRNWKPRTVKVNRAYLRNQILPWFGDRPIAEITRSEVKDWFAGLNETPAAADRSLPVLSVILREAEVYGYRTNNSNPCAGLRRYRRRGRERFLSVEEIRRLGALLLEQEVDEELPAAVVRLLLLTGCRQG